MIRSYATHAFCSSCGEWYQKQLERCPYCNRKLRHKSHHKSQIRKRRKTLI